MRAIKTDKPGNWYDSKQINANLNKKKSEKDEIDRLIWVANEVDEAAMAREWGKKILASHAHSQLLHDRPSLNLSDESDYKRLIEELSAQLQPTVEKKNRIERKRLL